MIDVGSAVPSLRLRATSGAAIDLAGLAGTVVVYVYPRTRAPDQPAIPGWDQIPGARGCTPQSCAFRDHHGALRASGAAYVFGLSAQSTEEQAEAAQRLHLPFPLLSDAGLHLARAMDLPTFRAGGLTLLKRLTMILRDGRVLRVMFPVDAPARNAQEVLELLQGLQG